MPGVGPFQSTAYQVGQILNALSTDSNGNLIFADIPNPNGVTLTELLNIIASNSGVLTGSKYYKDILTTDFVATEYMFPNQPTYLGFEYTIHHNFNLLSRNRYIINITETATGRQIFAQDIVAVDVNTINLIMFDTTPVSVMLTGF
jgi:hypothetical protein